MSRVCSWLVLGGLVALAGSCGFADCSFRKKESIIFFPTAAYPTPDHRAWNVPIHGWIFEPEDQSKIRQELLTLFCDALGIPKAETENPLFRARASAFLVENESKRQIVIRIGDKEFRLPASKKNGHFQDNVVIPAADVKGQTLTFLTAPCTEDTRVFNGEAQLLSDDGPLVVSDIDDTIKITEVHNHRAVLANTFLKEYRDVDGMATLYQSWARQGAAFAYVSGTPWQLEAALSAFLALKGFPSGSFYLRDFRWKDRSFFTLFQSPEVYKPPLLEDLCRRYPHRRFILVGDSGEKDPEIYAAFAQRHPRLVRHIYIRDLGNSDPSRFTRAFAELPRTMWTLFERPNTLANIDEIQ